MWVNVSWKCRALPKYLHRHLTSRAAPAKSKALLRWKSRFLLLSPLLHFNSNAIKAAQFVWARKLSFPRFLATTELCWFQSAQVVLQFNYIIDDRWRLWLYRKWKHDTRISCNMSKAATKCTSITQRNRKRKKRERNEFEKCESEWERIMNKLKWTVMLIIPFSSYFATPFAADVDGSPSRTRPQVENIPNQISSSQIWFSGSKTAKIEGGNCDPQ